MRLTYAAVPGFAARGAGAIINIASIVAIAPERLNGVYGASKAFVLAFTKSLQHELTDKGIRVQAGLHAKAPTGASSHEKLRSRLRARGQCARRPSD
jgi:short-subunit dehydrogenase